MADHAKHAAKPRVSWADMQVTNGVLKQVRQYKIDEAPRSVSAPPSRGLAMLAAARANVPTLPGTRMLNVAQKGALALKPSEAPAALMTGLNVESVFKSVESDVQSENAPAMMLPKGQQGRPAREESQTVRPDGQLTLGIAAKAGSPDAPAALTVTAVQLQAALMRSATASGVLQLGPANISGQSAAATSALVGTAGHRSKAAAEAARSVHAPLLASIVAQQAAAAAAPEDAGHATARPATVGLPARARPSAVAPAGSRATHGLRAAMLGISPPTHALPVSRFGAGLLAGLGAANVEAALPVQMAALSVVDRDDATMAQEQLSAAIVVVNSPPVSAAAPEPSSGSSGGSGSLSMRRLAEDAALLALQQALQATLAKGPGKGPGQAVQWAVSAPKQVPVTAPPSPAHAVPTVVSAPAQAKPMVKPAPAPIEPVDVSMDEGQGQQEEGRQRGDDKTVQQPVHQADETMMSHSAQCQDQHHGQEDDVQMEGTATVAGVPPVSAPPAFTDVKHKTEFEFASDEAAPDRGQATTHVVEAGEHAPASHGPSNSVPSTNSVEPPSGHKRRGGKLQGSSGKAARTTGAGGSRGRASATPAAQVEAEADAARSQAEGADVVTGAPSKAGRKSKAAPASASAVSTASASVIASASVVSAGSSVEQVQPGKGKGRAGSKGRTSTAGKAQGKGTPTGGLPSVPEPFPEALGLVPAPLAQEHMHAASQDEAADDAAPVQRQVLQDRAGTPASVAVAPVAAAAARNDAASSSLSAPPAPMAHAPKAQQHAGALGPPIPSGFGLVRPTARLPSLATSGAGSVASGHRAAAPAAVSAEAKFTVTFPLPALVSTEAPVQAQARAQFQAQAQDTSVDMGANDGMTGHAGLSSGPDVSVDFDGGQPDVVPSPIDRPQGPVVMEGQVLEATPSPPVRSQAVHGPGPSTHDAVVQACLPSEDGTQTTPSLWHSEPKVMMAHGAQQHTGVHHASGSPTDTANSSSTDSDCSMFDGAAEGLGLGLGGDHDGEVDQSHMGRAEEQDAEGQQEEEQEDQAEAIVQREGLGNHPHTHTIQEDDDDEEQEGHQAGAEAADGRPEVHDGDDVEGDKDEGQQPPQHPGQGVPMHASGPSVIPSTAGSGTKTGLPASTGLVAGPAPAPAQAGPHAVHAAQPVGANEAGPVAQAAVPAAQGPMDPPAPQAAAVAPYGYPWPWPWPGMGAQGQQGQGQAVAGQSQAPPHPFMWPGMGMGMGMAGLPMPLPMPLGLPFPFQYPYPYHMPLWPHGATGGQGGAPAGQAGQLPAHLLSALAAMGLGHDMVPGPAQPVAQQPAVPAEMHVHHHYHGKGQQGQDGERAQEERPAPAPTAAPPVEEDRVSRRLSHRSGGGRSAAPVPVGGLVSLAARQAASVRAKPVPPVPHRPLPQPTASVLVGLRPGGSDAGRSQGTEEGQDGQDHVVRPHVPDYTGDGDCGDDDEGEAPAEHGVDEGLGGYSQGQGEGHVWYPTDDGADNQPDNVDYGSDHGHGQAVDMGTGVSDGDEGGVEQPPSQPSQPSQLSGLAALPAPARAAVWVQQPVTWLSQVSDVDSEDSDASERAQLAAARAESNGPVDQDTLAFAPFAFHLVAGQAWDGQEGGARPPQYTRAAGTKGLALAYPLVGQGADPDMQRQKPAGISVLSKLRVPGSSPAS